MRDISDEINKTPFATDTYQFLATGKNDSPMFTAPYYTPHQMKTWWFKNKPRSFESVNHIFHDIGHVVDLFERGQKERLLQNEYGWGLYGPGSVVPVEWMITEMRVVTIQNLLTGVIYGKETNVNNPIFEADYRARTGGKLLPTRKKYLAECDRLYKEVDDKGFNHYLRLWEAACEYVKRNRNSAQSYKHY